MTDKYGLRFRRKRFLRIKNVQSSTYNENFGIKYILVILTLIIKVDIYTLIIFMYNF